LAVNQCGREKRWIAPALWRFEELDGGGGRRIGKKRQLGNAELWRRAMVSWLAGKLGRGDSGVTAAPCHRISP